MASELNPVPLSSPRSRPRAATAIQPTTTTTTTTAASSSLSSRRLSQVMVPPVVASTPSSLPGNVIPGFGEHGSVRSASGPLRHPKPLTPSDIHSMLEQEQEAMVNRLSRELSLLRQQTNSVASTTSSTSTTLNDSVDALHTSPYIINSTHPTASRRHRSSSSLSSSYIPAVQGSRAGSVSGIAPAREAYLPTARPDPSRTGRSRESSLTSPRQPEAALSASVPHHQTQHVDQPSYQTPGQPHRSSLSQQKTPMSSSMSRYDEVAYHRGEVDSLKRENELLRRRVRDLEHAVTKLKEQEAGSGPKVEDNTGTTSTEVA